MNICHFPSNHIQDVKKVFFEELSALYSKNELEVIIKRLLEHLHINPFEKDGLFNQSDLITLTEYIQDLKKGKPLEYILGYSYFFNLKFYVNPDVLIPRPETEELVYNVKEIVSKKYVNVQPLKILDIGTGSGCIAVTLSKIFSSAIVHAIDLFEKTLDVARQNAEYHQAKVEFYQLDVLKNILMYNYDIIVSNPPYIPIKDAEQIDFRVKNFEPTVALFSQTPFEFYERIFELSEKHLNKNGLIFLELNQYYVNEILKLAEKYQCFNDIEIIKDWSGNDRFIKCFKKSNDQ